jgi:hypothetical protein
MRVIEQNMLNAIQAKKAFTSANTCVSFDNQDATVYLHGHRIATVCPVGIVTVDQGTLLDYPTNTTKSRLRALGVDVCTKKGVLFLDGEPLNG